MRDEHSVLENIKPFRHLFYLGTIANGLVAFFQLMIVAVTQPIFDELSSSGGSGYVTEKSRVIRDLFFDLVGGSGEGFKEALPLILFVIFLCQAIFMFGSSMIMKSMGLKIVRHIRDKLFRNLVFQSVDFLAKSSTGDLASRITNDIDRVRVSFSETLTIVIRESLTIVWLLIFIFYTDWYMALLAFVIAPVAGVTMVMIGKLIKQKGVQAQSKLGHLSGFLAESVIGNKIVKACNMEESEVSRFGQLNKDHYKVNLKIVFISSFTSPIMHVVGGVVAALLFYIGLQRVHDEVISAGQFTSSLAALFALYNPIKRLAQFNTDWNLGKAAYERIVQILKKQNPIKDSADAQNLGKSCGSVEFRDVRFSYDDNVPILKGVSFEASKGEMVAIVGGSGAGKTTMMNLLMRFYDIKGGDILLDGKPIKSCTMESVRKNIGLVTQDVFLFNESIFYNITYGSECKDINEVRRVASLARADVFIDQLPDGYNTVVGERGVFLSTGQRQRLSIARALLRDPAILIFDEATSALDTESEKLIQEAMTEVMKGRTSFVIAHRLSTILEADTILVVDAGEIKEMGSHSALLKKRGLYYNLYNLQFPEMDIIM